MAPNRSLSQADDLREPCAHPAGECWRCLPIPSRSDWEYGRDCLAEMIRQLRHRQAVAKGAVAA